MEIQKPFLKSSIYPTPETLAGVYAIVNQSDGRMYIGSTCKLGRRRAVHQDHFRTERHSCKRLQCDFLKNPENFELSILEFVDDKKKRIEREEFWVKFFKTHLPENGYNSSPTGTCVGYKQTAEHIEKVASKNRGRKVIRTPEWNKKLGAAHIGKRNKNQIRSLTQLDLAGNKIAAFECISDAARAMGSVKRCGNIVQALKGRYKQAFGYRWEYGA